MQELKKIIATYSENNPKEMDFFSKKWTSLKKDGSSTVTRSLSLASYELDLLNIFCAKNSISVGTLIRVLFLNDGAFEIPFLAGISIQKRMNVDFAELNIQDFIPLTDSDFGKDPIKSWKSSSFRIKSVPIPVLIMEKMNNWVVKNKYPSWTGFIRIKLLKIGVIPPVLKDHILSSLHNIKSDITPTVTKQNSLSTSLSVSQLNHFLWNSLNQFAKKKYNISAGMYFKMILEHESIIDYELKGKNKLSKPFSVDKLNSVKAAISQDPSFPGLSLTKEEFDHYSELTPNKNISISISKANLPIILDYDKDNVHGLAGLLEKYIFYPMKKEFVADEG